MLPGGNSLPDIGACLKLGFQLFGLLTLLFISVPLRSGLHRLRCLLLTDTSVVFFLQRAFYLPHPSCSQTLPLLVWQPDFRVVGHTSKRFHKAHQLIKTQDCGQMIAECLQPLGSRLWPACLSALSSWRPSQVTFGVCPRTTSFHQLWAGTVIRSQLKPPGFPAVRQPSVPGTFSPMRLQSTLICNSHLVR